MAIARGIISYHSGAQRNLNSPQLTLTPPITPMKHFTQTQQYSIQTLHLSPKSPRDEKQPPSLKESMSTTEDSIIEHASTTILQSSKKLEEESFTLNEDEIEEKFIRGSGPGGQKINKTSSCVELKHIKTGIVVKCQETRSQDQNRKIARSRLLEKLKQMFTPSLSEINKKKEKQKKRKSETERRRKLKEEATKGRVEL